METGLGSYIVRKLITTFVSTFMFSILLAFLSFHDSTVTSYNQGNAFIGWFLIFFMYSGAIILIYGNLVSVGVDYLQRKWFKHQDWLYVFILGVFGLVNGVFFQEKMFALFGMFAAVLYALIDKRLYKRKLENKSIKMFLLIPIVSLVLFWGYFQYMSPPMPPFTMEDAVESATSGVGTALENFPKEIGTQEIIIDGYQVIRKTKVEEIEKEYYLVSFTEEWKKGTATGYWTQSYKIGRNSFTSNSRTGKIPPYYMNN
jgi:hypothetical protein